MLSFFYAVKIFLKSPLQIFYIVAMSLILAHEIFCESSIIYLSHFSFHTDNNQCD
jgi:hypothetical protein